MHHGVHVIRLELVVEGLQIRFAARENCFIDRQGITVIDPIGSAPGVRVHVEAVDV